MRLGRNRPIAPAPKLRLSNYTLRKLSPPPDAVDYSVKPHSFLANILGTDQYGDCTCAAAFHIAGALLANADVPIPSEFNTEAVVRMYTRLTGGPDVGLDEQVVFNWWRVNGLLPDGSHAITTKVFVDTSNVEEVKTALWLFENLYIVAELPDAWISPFPSADGFTWGPAGAPNPENGHAFCAFSYGQGAVQKVDTWGLLGNIPFTALATYANPKSGGGCYAVLSQDVISRATSKASNGFDWSQLQADIASFQP